MNCRIGCRSSEIIWSMNVTLLEPRGNPEPGDRDTSSSSHELPMESRERVEPGSGKHSVFSHFPKDPNCDICLKTKITRAYCRRRANAVMPRAENFGDLIAADHKVLSEESETRNNHRYAVVVQDLATQWLQSYQCKTKTSQETQKSLQKFLEPTRKPWVIYTDNNSSEFGKSCEERSWNHCTSMPPRLRFGLPLNGPVIPFGAMVEYHPISAKELSRLHQFGPGVLPSIFLGSLIAGENLERRHSSRRHWRIGADGRIWNPRQNTQC